MLTAITGNKRARVEVEKLVRRLLQKARQGVVVVLTIASHSNRSSTNNGNQKCGINICVGSIAIIVI